jgi:hypothetical protein
MYVTVCRLLAVAAVLMWAGDAAAQATRDTMKKRPRRLLETTHMVYRAFQGDEQIGTETVTREVWNDNTLVYRGRIAIKMQAGVAIDEDVDLELEEESRFPRELEMDKTMRQGEQVMEQEVSIELFANVAVVKTKLPTSSETRNVVLPSGTPLVESTIVHHFYPLLFWYDEQRGGRQTFRVFEISRGKPDDIVIRVAQADTVNVLGTPEPVEIYAVEWATHTTHYYVDVQGRVVRANLGYMRFELEEWTAEQHGDGDGP